MLLPGRAKAIESKPLAAAAGIIRGEGNDIAAEPSLISAMIKN